MEASFFCMFLAALLLGGCAYFTPAPPIKHTVIEYDPCGAETRNQCRRSTMITTDTATLLEDAANRIADVSRPDLQIMLRRAALLLRNSGSMAFDDDIEEALRDLSGEFGKTRNDMVRFIVREWMEKNTYLPVHELEEDGEVDGTA